MSKRKNQTFEWEVGEDDWDDDVELIADVDPVEIEQSTRKFTVPRRLMALSGVLTLLLAAYIGYRLWDGYHDGINRIRRDIQATSDLEAWAWLNKDPSLADSLVSPNASSSWRSRVTWTENRLREWVGDNADTPTVELSEPEVRGDVALVRATVALTNTLNHYAGYSETRFYERSSDGVWRRTSPDARFWGDQRQLASEHFKFTYRMRDHTQVRAVLPQLEAFYGQALRDLKLNAADIGPFEIEIVPTTDNIAWRFSNDRRLTTTSAHLLPTTIGYAPEERLLRSVVSPLAYYLVQRAVERPTALGDWVAGADWGRVTFGVAQWLALSGAPLPTAWQAQLEADFRRDLASGGQPQLVGLTSYEANRAFSSRYSAQMIPISLADYIAAAYGRDKLGALLSVIKQYRTWDEVSRAVFGVERAAFEAGWQAHVRARYTNPVINAMSSQ